VGGIALNYVSLVCDYRDGTGTPVSKGSVTFAPNVVVLDASDHVIISQFPVTVSLFRSPSPTVSLIACDNAGLNPSGWAWSIQPVFPGAPPGQLYLIDFANGATQYLSDLTPAASAPSVLVPLALTLPVPVADGGTGEASLTPYAPLAGGINPAAQVQQCTTGMGTAGTVLTSNGTSSLPSFQPPPGITGTVTVAQGGTGDSSLTPWAPLAGGTTGTGAVQQATTHFAAAWGSLLSQGASALPIWEPPVVLDSSGGAWELTVTTGGALGALPVMQDGGGLGVLDGSGALIT